MKKLISYPFNFNEFKKIWKSEGLNEDIDVSDNLLKNNPLLHETLFMQGNALAVLDIKTMKYPIILGDVEKVCGWSADYFYEKGVEGFVDKFLPEDFIGLGEISRKINSYIPNLSKEQIKLFRAIYDCRMWRKDGSYTRVCQESIALKTDKNGNILYFLAHVSDITPFKREGKQHLYLSGGAKSHFYEIDNTNSTCTELPQLTKREKEIAKLISQGFASEQIAEKLFISLFTVNTHRQNMLRKFGLIDTLELMNFLKIYRLI